MLKTRIMVLVTASEVIDNTVVRWTVDKTEEEYSIEDIISVSIAIDTDKDGFFNGGKGSVFMDFNILNRSGEFIEGGDLKTAAVKLGRALLWNLTPRVQKELGGEDMYTDWDIAFKTKIDNAIVEAVKQSENSNFTTHVDSLFHKLKSELGRLKLA